MARAEGYLVLAALSLSWGCRATGSARLTRVTDDAGDPTVVLPTDAASVDGSVPQTEPHVLLSADPPHGPFSGGTLVLLRGNGFASNARVWFGDAEVPASDVIPIDPHRIQVTAPPGAAGLADLVVQNADDESTRTTLAGGYAYDAFYADPSSGPTSGGTLITLHGTGTHWDDATTVTIDRNPCEIVSVDDAVTLQCRVPAGTTGAKPVRVTTSDQVAVDVLDAFTYSNSDNGFRGGLSGAPVDHSLKVLAFGSLTGEAIPGATVIVGGDAPIVSKTDGNGVVVIDSPALGKRNTVTLARHCFEPVTFVDVPIDTLTVYLDPVISPSCFDPGGDLENGGGTTGQSSTVRGELVWPETQEFRKSGFTNVPEPASNSETKAAYVFALSAKPTDGFRLPGSGSAVTQDSPGSTGYQFSLPTRPGNYTLYALAGIENRALSPPAFTAYAMGLIRGVAVPAGGGATDVFIRIDVPLDHALTLAITPPEATAVGPNLLLANVAIRVGSEGYAILPAGRQQALLGSVQTLDFVGIPALVGSLSGTSYVAAAQAVTGSGGGLPRSVLGLLSATTTSTPLAVGPFIEIPVLGSPTPNGSWNGQDLAWHAAAGGQAANLAIIDIETAAGLYDWRIVAPAGTRSVRLPDLSAIATDIAWPSGEQTIQVTLASVPGFDYANLRYRDMAERGWSAYAADSFFATY